MTTFDDFCRFASLQLSSGDIDPAYPVLRTICQGLQYDEEQVCDLVFTYVAYYNLASALSIAAANNGVPWPTREDIDRGTWEALPTGTERRGHRNKPALRAHLVALDEIRNRNRGLDMWIAHQLTGAPESDWRHLQIALRSIHGNGRWAAYKTGEILAYLGWPLKPTDAGHDFSSGPRKGLALLEPDASRLVGSTPRVVDQLDGLTEALRQRTSERLGGDVPVEQLETLLCDFNSLTKGHYYVGHDIDQQLGQLAASTHLGDMASIAAGARFASFHPRFLGEAHGWLGVRPDLRRLWKSRHRLVWWEDDE